MRQAILLCKGKRIDNNQWTEGLLTLIKQKYHIVDTFSDNIPHPVHTKTITKYIGSTDKNDEKIWDNSILTCPKRGTSFWRCCIVWNEIHARYDVIAMGCPFPFTHEADPDNPKDIAIYGSDYEIIGNKIDNPELLYDFKAITTPFGVIQ